MPDIGVSTREYFDLKFAHIERGIADLKAQALINQTRADGELRELGKRLDAMEKENDERRGREKVLAAGIAMSGLLGYLIERLLGGN